MHTALAFQEAVCLVAFNLHRHGLDAGFVTILIVADGYLVFMCFSPTLVHAHEHRSPVLTFRSTCARIDFQHGVHAICLLAKHVLQLQRLNQVECLGIVLVHFLFGHELFLVVVKSQFEFVAGSLHLVVAVQPLANVLHFFHLSLRSLGVFPKVGCLCAKLFFFHFHALLLNTQVSIKRFRALFYVFKLVCCNHNKF